MSNFETMKRAVESGARSQQTEKLSQEYIDLARIFGEVFSTDNGKKVLEHLDAYSQKNFPNYEHQNAVLCTYSKIGEQTLVKYIKGLIKLSKKER